MTDLLTDKEENVNMNSISELERSLMLLSQLRLLMSTELNALNQDHKLKLTKLKENRLLKRRELKSKDLKRSELKRTLFTLREKLNTKALLLLSKLLKLSLLSKANYLPQLRSNS